MIDGGVLAIRVPCQVNGAASRCTHRHKGSLQLRYAIRVTNSCVMAVRAIMLLTALAQNSTKETGMQNCFQRVIAFACLASVWINCHVGGMDLAVYHRGLAKSFSGEGRHKS